MRKLLLACLIFFKVSQVFSMGRPWQMRVPDLPTEAFELVEDFFPLGGLPAMISVNWGGRVSYKNYSNDFFWDQLPENDPEARGFISDLFMALYDDMDEKTDFKEFLDERYDKGSLIVGSAGWQAAREIFSVSPQGGDDD